MEAISDQILGNKKRLTLARKDFFFFVFVATILRTIYPQRLKARVIDALAVRMKIPPEENQGYHRLSPSRCSFFFILFYLIDDVVIVHDFVITVVIINVVVVVVVALSLLIRR